MIFFDKRETVLATLFIGKTPLRTDLISSDSAVLKAAAAVSLSLAAMAASTFLTKVRTLLLRAPLITLRLLLRLILVLPIYDWPFYFILYKIELITNIFLISFINSEWLFSQQQFLLKMLIFLFFARFARFWRNSSEAIELL